MTHPFAKHFRAWLFLVVCSLTVPMGAQTKLQLAGNGDKTFVMCNPRDVNLVWMGSRFLAIEKRSGQEPILCWADRSGRAQRFALAIPGADELYVRAIAGRQAEDQDLAVVGSALGGRSQYTSFLAMLSPIGKVKTVIRLWPYTAARIVALPDGTYWTLGWLSDDADTATLNFCLLKRFSADGKELLTVKPAVSPGSSTASASTRLYASQDRLALLTDKNDYIEFDFEGNEIFRAEKLPIPNRGASHSFAISPSNDAVLGFFQDGQRQMVTLDREQRRWIPLATDGVPPRFYKLLGFDGDQLVVGQSGAGVDTVTRFSLAAKQ